MDHGGLFDGPVERDTPAMAGMRRIGSKEGNQGLTIVKKTNALTIAEWTSGSRFVIRRYA